MDTKSIFQLYLNKNIYNENFKKAFLDLMNYEGGYSWYSNDNGGETIFGIAREYNHNWPGFVQLDEIKRLLNLSNQDLIDKPSNMKKIDKFIEDNIRNELVQKLLQNTIDFYYSIYKHYKLNQLDELGAEVFDTGINQGFKRAIKTLQKTLNLLNRNQKDFKDLVVDGIIGSKTINAYNILKNQGIEDIVKNVYKLYKGKFYIDLMEKNREKYSQFRGWFRRI